MTCWPWRHGYQPVAVQVVEDISFGKPGMLRTDILRVCDRCGATRTRSVRGPWSLAEVQGRPCAQS